MYLTGDGIDRSGNVQKNAAMALARLVQDPTNMAVLRANHGMEILRHYVSPAVKDLEKK